MFENLTVRFVVCAIGFAAFTLSGQTIAQSGDVYGANSPPTSCQDAKLRESQIYRQRVAAIARMTNRDERLRKDQDEQTRHKKVLVDIEVMCFVPSMDPSSRCAAETANEAKLAMQNMGALRKRQLDIQNQNWRDRWDCNGARTCIAAADRKSADAINRVSTEMSDENARHRNALTAIQNGHCSGGTNGGNPEETYPQVRRIRPKPVTPTIAPTTAPPYILNGTYDVYQGAWNSGDSPAGWTSVVVSGPNTYQLRMKTGQAVIRYIGPGNDGTRIYGVTGSNRRLAFNRLPGDTGVVIYDVHWLGAATNGQNVVETWVLKDVAR